MSGSGKAEVGAGEKRARLKAALGAILRPPVAATAALILSVIVAVAAVAATRPPARKGGVNAVEAPVAGPITYHALPDFIADLKTSRTKVHYVQIAAVVEIPVESTAKLQESETQIIADMQTCLRDLQRQDLAGAAGIERLRGMMLSIVHQHIAPADARDVLFTRFLVD